MSSTGTSAATLRLPAHSRAVPTQTRLRTRRLPAAWLALTALGLALAVVVGAHVTGLWVTSGRGLPAGSAMSRSDGQTRGQPFAESGEGTGAGPDESALPATPQDVKGWMSLQQVLDAQFPGVTEAGMRAALDIPANVPTTTALKDLPSVVDGLDVPALRAWLDAPTLRAGLADAAQSDG